MSSVKVVILDIGGVVCPSPFPVFERYEKKSGMPKGSINSLLAHDEDWEELECGHIGAPTFVKRVLERKQLNMGNIFEELGRGAPDAGLCVLLNALRSAGVRLCAVTNNFFLDSSRSASAFPESIRGLFDVVVESCKEGVRKGKGGRGGSAIFRTAVERLGVRPEECLFLDDIGGNLKDARDLGMHTESVSEWVSEWMERVGRGDGGVQRASCQESRSYETVP
uniref:Uncharacterized protein n=1 Tax=Chromera velia CCMP2878 TaxID=1169474 RepID=A0A0G4I7V7_9ALVE|eukprot:Cvel_1966.t1-p1 / transcript=Cvel_1966.t1 / gene=Cvel_1966 / organism=Chromera_velia_CCMP2878 / gene_product=Acyl-CoA dehydrogenase family member 10, putative / transcript_product=Acyl-CoA dehydrogenase family member 10, putative / location=Cvel_scaffold74:146312-149675(+) / protein_length=222 / sequence_SO=supercontig / SO=protein_coding / is_pseudo=false